MEQLDDVEVPTGRRYAPRSGRRLMRNEEPEPPVANVPCSHRPASEASSVTSSGAPSSMHRAPPPPLAHPPPALARPPPTLAAPVVPLPQAAPRPPAPASGEDLSEEVELSIAQRAVMERYTSNLHVQFTEEQAQALEMAAVEKAMKESEREEAAMWGLNVEHKPDGARVVVPPGRPPAAGGAPPPAMALPPNMPSPRTTQPVRTQSQPYTPFDEPDIMPGPSVDYRPTFASPGAGMRYYHATTEDAATPSSNATPTAAAAPKPKKGIKKFANKLLGKKNKEPTTTTGATVATAAFAGAALGAVGPPPHAALPPPAAAPPPHPQQGYSSGEDTPAEPLQLHAVQGPPMHPHDVDPYYGPNPDGTPAVPLHAPPHVQASMDDDTPQEPLRLQAVQQQHSDYGYFDHPPPMEEQPLPLSAVQQLQGDRSGVVLANGRVAQYAAEPPSVLGAVYVHSATGQTIALHPPAEYLNTSSRASSQAGAPHHGPAIAAGAATAAAVGAGAAAYAAQEERPRAQSPPQALPSAARAEGAPVAAAASGGAAAEEDELARAIRESEEEARRQREAEEADFEEQLRRALEESQATAAGPPRAAAPGYAVGYADEDEEELLRRVLEESAREEEARTRAFADEEQLLIAKIMRESLEEAYMPAFRSSAPQQQPQHMDDDEFERALAASRMGGPSMGVATAAAGAVGVGVGVAAAAAAAPRARKGPVEEPQVPPQVQPAAAVVVPSVGDAEVEDIVREIKELQLEFGVPLEALQGALTRQRADRAVIERDLAAARESRNPNSVTLSAQLARSGKELRELERRTLPVEQVLEELTTMQQFVQQERPGRAEFNVVRDMVLKKLVEELSAAGWAVSVAGTGDVVEYHQLASQLAEQTQPLLKQGPPTTPPPGSIAAAAAAAAAAETAAGAEGQPGGSSTEPATPAGKGYDLNSTLQGLQEMRARIEARKAKRTQEATQGSGSGGAAAGGGGSNSSPSAATSAYQKALLNLKASMSKPGEGAAVAAGAAGGTAAGFMGMRALNNRRRGAYEDGSSSDEDASEDVVVPKRDRAAHPNLFNPEGLFQAKREWARNNAKTDTALSLPQHCFEHLLVVGLPPTIDAAYLEQAAATVAKQRPDAAKDRVKGPKGPTLPAEVLYSYPPDKPLDNASLIADFCFPAGVQPRMLERTPSMSSLNQVIYRQSCNDSDDRSFVFVLAVQATERLPLYGVCCYVDEFVFLPPPIAGDAVPSSRPGLSRHVVAAPRCYCLLSHYPFFPLHFQVLNLMLSLGRLERIKLLERELTTPPTSEMAARLANAAIDDSTTGNSPASITDGDSAASTTMGMDPTADAGGLQVASARQVLQRYYEHRVPGLGEVVNVSPDPSLTTLTYTRPRFPDLPPPTNVASLVRMADAESADALRHWTIATLCRCLSLNNILSLLTSVLLERQVALFCPNIGLLSGCVLAMVPLLRPFSWQSLMLPVLPLNMLEIVEAPFPFVVGIQYKTADIRNRCANIARVNVYKNRVKLSGSTPQLPGHSTLVTKLVKSYAMLAAAGKAEEVPHQPVYRVTDGQRNAADSFLEVLQQHLCSFCANLQAHTITDVQHSDRVSMLLKESFVDSFPAKDRPFFKEFVETQLFSVYSDTLLN